MSTMTEVLPKLIVNAQLILAWLVVFLCVPQVAPAQEAKPGKPVCASQAGAPVESEYAGRFKMARGSVLIVESGKGELTLRPIFWRAAQPLRRISGDSFAVQQRPDRQVTFIHDEQGCVVAVRVTGFGNDGTFPRLGDERVPIELLFEGRPEEAAKRMVKAEPSGIEEFVEIARTLLQRYPSRSLDAVRFLSTLVQHYPRAATVRATLGDAYVATGQRKLAVYAYLEAGKLDSTNEAALRGLRRLRSLPASTSPNQNGWTVPFSLSSVFRKPVRAEIKSVEDDWATRDLSPRDVVEVTKSKLNLGHTEAVVRIISHSIHGQKHYGAIIMPEGTEDGTHPVVLDLKGVSWDYSPLDLNRLLSPQFLGPDQKRFIYVVPSFRGEVLKFNGTDYISEGDRTDSWDGATDDALSLLNVALSVTPQADQTRVCAFGKSRGGSVALLAGIRDQRIRLVLDWSGPVDWFELMATEGWTQAEIVADALLNRAQPQEEGGQFIERFLAKAMKGEETAGAVRLKMLASSPLYFAGSIRRLQVHYGVEDEMVPVVNGRTLAELMKKSKRNDASFKAFFHANAGHDLDERLAYVESRKFLLSLLSAN